MRTPIVVVVALTVGSLSGCGTIFNFASGDPQVYGGVSNDLTFMGKPRGSGGGKAALAFMIVMAAELPMTITADTLTAPLAAYIQKQHNSEPGSEGVVFGNGQADNSAPSRTRPGSSSETEPELLLHCAPLPVLPEPAEPAPSPSPAQTEVIPPPALEPGWKRLFSSPFPPSSSLTQTPSCLEQTNWSLLGPFSSLRSLSSVHPAGPCGWIGRYPIGDGVIFQMEQRGHAEDAASGGDDYYRRFDEWLRDRR